MTKVMIIPFSVCHAELVSASKSLWKIKVPVFQYALSRNLFIKYRARVKISQDDSLLVVGKVLHKFNLYEKLLCLYPF